MADSLTFVSQCVFFLRADALRSSQVVMELFKANGLENPVLIVLTESRAKEKEKRIFAPTFHFIHFDAVLSHFIFSSIYRFSEH